MSERAASNWMWLVASLALVSLVSAIGGAVTAESVETWYPGLAKPSFNPPEVVFPVVWTILYAMMGVAAFLVFKTAGRTPEGKRALIAYAVQLALNLLWSVLFFGLRLPVIAGIEILILFAAILYTMALFRPINRTAAWLLAPYAFWVAFASVLNWQIVALNP